VPSRRVVTAAHVAACQADAEMQPLAPLAQAVLAAGDLGGKLRQLDSTKMSASACHSY
jgi:hypothetical protein